MQATAIRSHARTRNPTPRAMPMRLLRFWLIGMCFLVWACTISGRLFWLQILRHQEYVDRAQKQQQRTFEVAPRRGILYDRNLRELAMTVQVNSIYAVPTEIEDKAAAARTLSAIVHSDPADTRTTAPEIEQRLDEGRGFAWVARKVPDAVADHVKALNMKGIYFQKEYQRFYPDNLIAAQVLGYVGTDDVGLGGMEEKFEPRLHGVPGRMFTAMDARRKVLGSSQHDPEPGQNLELTIDENIQFMAEQALDHAMERTDALNGTVVVQDVHTGQILALAIRPTFNPNDFRHTTPSLLRDHAVSDVYEPGSTFKLVAYSAALDQGLVKPDDMVDCQGGQITLAGRVIHDNQGEHFGVIPVHKALEESSDVGAVKMALKVGPQNFYQYIRAFGFGSKPGVELPGETRGLLRPANKWGPSSIGSIAIGQEIAVTPLQLVSMVSTIANGGVYLPPHVLMPGQLTASSRDAAPMEARPFKADEDLPNPLPPGAHRVLSTLAAAEMRKMMEGVVLYGTGKPAQLNGYSAGGKTGTAQKVDPVTHLYSKTMHIASFAGIAPVNNPVIAVAIVIDTPRKGPSYYGTAVSAPVFAEVAQKVLEYLGVRHDEEVRPAKVKPQVDYAREDDQQNGGDIAQLYAAVNDLPSDDALRAETPQPVQQPERQNTAAASQPPVPSPAQAQPTAPAHAVAVAVAAAPHVVMDVRKQIQVPSFMGMSIRQVIETAAGAGLEVEVAGSGTVREQAPTPGTMVAPGTRVVVRGTR